MGMALSTVSGILTRIGMGKLGRLGLEPAVRYATSDNGGRADPYRRQEAWGASRRSWQARSRRATPALQHDLYGRDRQAAQHRWLGVRAHRDRRLHAPGLRRGSWATRRHRQSSPSYSAPSCSFKRHGMRVQQLLTDNGSATARSCTRSLAEPWASATYAPAPTGLRPTAKARALHPHHARRLGLRRDLPQQQRAAPRRLTDGSGSLQPSSKTLSARPQAPDRPPQRAEPTFSVPTSRPARV